MLEVLLEDELYERVFWYGRLPVVPRKDEHIQMPYHFPGQEPDRLHLVVVRVTHWMTMEENMRAQIIVGVRPWTREDYEVLEKLAEAYKEGR